MGSSPNANRPTAQREDPQKNDACGVPLREHLRKAGLVLRLLSLVFEDDIGAVHAEHHAARLLVASFAFQPQGRLGDFASADQQEDAGDDGGAEHESPSAIDVAQSEADDCSHGGAQIPRRRDHAHRYRAVVLGGEFGDERGCDGVVGAYEDADEEAVYHEQKRRRRGCRRARRCQRISFRLRRIRDSFLGCHIGSLGPCRTVGNAFRFALRRRKRAKARKTHF